MVASAVAAHMILNNTPAHEPGDRPTTLKGPSLQSRIAVWQNAFAAQLETDQQLYPAQLPITDLHKLIDGCDGILRPRLEQILNARYIPGVTRERQLSIVRCALTAWLRTDPTLVTWKINNAGPLYVAVSTFMLISSDDILIECCRQATAWALRYAAVSSRNLKAAQLLAVYLKVPFGAIN
jgi:hypothetical protein